MRRGSLRGDGSGGGGGHLVVVVVVVLLRRRRRRGRVEVVDEEATLGLSGVGSLGGGGVDDGKGEAQDQEAEGEELHLVDVAV